MFTAVNSKEVLAILLVVAAVHSCELCQFQFANDSFQKLSQACSLCEVHPESVAVPLIPAGHFGRGVTELLLDITLVDIGGGGKTGAQGMT